MLKKLALVLVLVLLAASAFAVENSNTYMPLVSSAQFLNRVTYILAMESPVVLAEASATACHNARASFAVSVAKNPAGYAGIMAVHLATNINVTSGGALTGTGLTLDTPATDAALLAAVASLWSTVSGCIVNP